MANTTRARPRRRGGSAAISAGSVVTGTPSSRGRGDHRVLLVASRPSRPSRRRGSRTAPTVTHSRSVCPSERQRGDEDERPLRLHRVVQEAGRRASCPCRRPSPAALDRALPSPSTHVLHRSALVRARPLRLRLRRAQARRSSAATRTSSAVQLGAQQRPDRLLLPVERPAAPSGRGGRSSRSAAGR